MRTTTWEVVPGSEIELPATTIMVAIGEEPDPSILPEGAGIEVSGWAGIVADPRTLATGRAGIFAGGDVVSGPKTIIDAVASGRRAAGSIHEYLSGARDGEAEIFAAVRYPTPPEPALSLRLSQCGPVRTRRCRSSSRARSGRPRSDFDEARGAGRGEPLLPVRCRPRLPDRARPVGPRSGGPTLTSRGRSAHMTSAKEPTIGTGMGGAG